MVEYDKGGARRLLVGYTDDRAKKDTYNREKGIRRLEKAYKHGALTKGNINKRDYNKFLSMDGEVKVAINYDRVADDSKWDGLKGYLTNTDIPIQDIYAAYHNLWHVERAFRIAKSMSWHGFTDFKQECVTSWTKLFATNEVQFTDNAIDNFLAFVDYMSCSADTYVSLGGSNGCADQLTNWDGTQKVGLGAVLRKKPRGFSL